MEFKKDKIELPFATIVLGLLFCAVYLFKVGESYFYDYPVYYIYLSIPDVINIALKAIFFYMVVIAVYISVMSWELARVCFLASVCLTAALKIYAMLSLYLSGGASVLAYINRGTIMVLFSLLGFLISIAISNEESSIKIDPRNSFFAFLVFLVLNFFIGLNYHSFFPNSTWQTEDDKVLVGTYKDNLLFRKCVDGKPYFYLEEEKGQKLEMFKINTSGVLALRCM